MARRSPLEYDISVSADKQRRARVRGMTGAFESATRVCDHPGCAERGRYRAPRAPAALDSFYWFCLDHVRDYNRAWNFFADRSADEIERQMAADRLWGRPTWTFGNGAGPAKKPLSANAEGLAWRRLGLDDPMELLGANATINPGAGRDGMRPRRRLPAMERRALDVLGAREDMGKAEIRRLYKDLVKQLHPDSNAGSRADEERLQEVVWAWEQLRSSPALPD
jgi:DnaJ-domain-containing protein 1